MEQQTAYRFAWQSVEIEVIYTQRRWSVIDHLSIRSVSPEGAPLPITSTGYRSHFMKPDTIEAHGGDVVAQVTAWLDEEAAKPAWRALVEASRQGDLFGSGFAAKRLIDRNVGLGNVASAHTGLMLEAKFKLAFGLNMR